MARDLTIASHPDGSVLEVWAVPRSRRSEIAGRHDGALRVRLAAPPEGGKANRALVQLLGKRLRAKVRVERGAATRRKLIIVEGLAPEEVRARLGPT